MGDLSKRLELVNKARRKGVGKHNEKANILTFWAEVSDNVDKAKRILSVAKRMEQRYRAWYGLERLWM